MNGFGSAFNHSLHFNDSAAIISSADMIILMFGLLVIRLLCAKFIGYEPIRQIRIG